MPDVYEILLRLISFDASELERKGYWKTYSDTNYLLLLHATIE